MNEELESLDINALSSNALRPWLSRVPTDILREFLLGFIQEMDSGLAAKMYFGGSSFDDMIPRDVIQKMLSFLLFDTESTRSVNRDWQRISDGNERSYYLELQGRLQRECPIPFDSECNETWIVDPKRSKLSKTEKELGFKGPEILIMATFHIKDGDRIFVHGRCLEQGLVFPHLV